LLFSLFGNLDCLKVPLNLSNVKIPMDKMIKTKIYFKYLQKIKNKLLNTIQQFSRPFIISVKISPRNENIYYLRVYKALHIIINH